MSESSCYYDSDEDEVKKDENCALVDAISEINFEENNITKSEIPQDTESNSDDPSSSSLNFIEDEYDFYHDSEWVNQKCQVFILSTAGKPIYSLHGSEEKLITLFGLLQALVSVVQSR
jgi:First Longin domain of FUZ, MON1 and HPS1